MLRCHESSDGRDSVNLDARDQLVAKVKSETLELERSIAELQRAG